MKDYMQKYNSLSEEKKKKWWAWLFELAYRECIDEMTTDEINKKTEEFKFKWLNIELDENAVDEMFTLMEESKEWEKKKPDLYEICTNHSLKKCDWNCECDYNIIRDGLLNNLVKTVDLVRKANLRHGE